MHHLEVMDIHASNLLPRPDHSAPFHGTISLRSAAPRCSNSTQTQKNAISINQSCLNSVGNTGYDFLKSQKVTSKNCNPGIPNPGILATSPMLNTEIGGIPISEFRDYKN